MQVIKDVRQCWQQLDANGTPQLPKWQQLMQMLALYVGRGIGPGYFLQGRWWRPDIAFADKWRHVNKTEYHRFIDRWNLPPYQKTSQHKIVEKAVLQLLGVPTPAFIGFLHQQAGVDQQGRPLCSLADLTALAEQLCDRKICLKPVEGYGGAGFAAFRLVRDGTEVLFEHPFNGQRQRIADWYQLARQNPDGYIVEHYLEQHPVLAALHPHSVNTLRIWVYQLPDRTAIAGAFLRVGQKGSLVDNTSSGGLYCPVDPKSGQLKFGVYARQSWQQLATHPDTGVAISGTQLPFWAECQALAGRALQAFPHVRVAGVDVAIGVDGPRMIELNVRPDQIGCTRMDLPLKQIDDLLRQAYGSH